MNANGQVRESLERAVGHLARAKVLARDEVVVRAIGNAGTCVNCALERVRKMELEQAGEKMEVDG